MTTHIKTALALMTGVVLGGAGFGALHAQTKAQPALLGHRKSWRCRTRRPS